VGRLVAAALVVAACKQDAIDVHRGPSTGDYNHAALVAAVDAFVANGRTAAAYAELARTVLALRPGMDKTVADEAELRLIVLAVPPIEAIKDRPIEQRRDALALTVWPTLIAPPIEADAMRVVRDPRAGQLAPRPGEAPADYLVRLCGGPLAAQCKRVVPEYQAEVIDAYALRRGTERARSAVDDCQSCSSERADPGWHRAVAAWEELDRAAAESITTSERRADPDNWPIAGAASDDDPGLPEAELSSRGDVVIGGHSYGPNQQRIDVLRELRGRYDALALHLGPGTTLAQARGVLIDARKSGASRVAVVAREPVYPWRRKVYWIADGSGLRANLRPTDSLQLLVHAIDEVAGPGTVARVD
jgi:hypothetical protein